MRPYKIGTGIAILLLVFAATGFPLTVLSQFAQGTLAAFAALHIVEMFYYRDVLRDAPGSQRANILKVFIFGIFHVVEMRDEIRAIQLERIRRAS